MIKNSAIPVGSTSALVACSQSNNSSNNSATTQSNYTNEFTEASTDNLPEQQSSSTLTPEMFGALGDGKTDDTVAFNKLFEVIRNSFVQANNSTTLPDITVGYNVQLGKGRRYRIDGSINATGIWAHNWVIYGEGAVLEGYGSDKIVLDLTSSRFFTIHDLLIWGDSNSTPLVGIQVGRNDTQVTGNFHMSNVRAIGTFNRSSFYNYCAENAQYDHCIFWNDKATSDSYAMIMDGNNTWGITSDYQTINVSSPQPQSFTLQQFNNCTARKQISGSTIWMSRTSGGHKYINSYAVSYDSVAIVISSDNFGHSDLYLDIHCETSGVSPGVEGAIKFVGTTTDPIIRDFSYLEHASHASDYIFDADSLNSLTFRSLYLNITTHHQLPATIFSGKSKFTIYNGLVIVPDASRLTNIAEFYGTYVCDDYTKGTWGYGNYTIIDRQGNNFRKGELLQRSNHIQESSDLASEPSSTLRDGLLELEDGVSNVDSVSGKALIFVDRADGQLKVRFGDGTTKRIVTDS